MSDIFEQIAIEESKISAFSLQLATKGVHAKPFNFSDGNPIEKLCAARAHVNFLDQLLAQTPTFVSAAPAPVAATTSAPVTKLASEEVSRLTWTEQVRYAQGKLSDADAKVVLAGRAETKKSKGKTLTEQCLEANQGS